MERSKKEHTATKSEGSEEGTGDAETGLSEDLCRVVCNDVDTAELLHEHDDEGREGGTAITRNGEKLDVSVVRAVKCFLGLEQYVNV